MCADVLSSSSALIDMLITAYGTVLLRVHCWKSIEEICKYLIPFYFTFRVPFLEFMKLFVVFYA